MQPINDFLPSIESGKQTVETGLREAKTQNESANISRSEAQPRSWMRHLWDRMSSIYGHKWTSAYGDQVKDEWSQGLIGITGEQIRHGLQQCIASADPWPPSLPEFRAYCLGIPSLAAVQIEVAGKSESGATPFGRLVWSCVDQYAYRHASQAENIKMVAAAYGLAREHVMRGGELPEVVAAIEKSREPEPERKVTPEVGKQALSDLMAKLYASETQQEQQGENHA